MISFTLFPHTHTFIYPHYTFCGSYLPGRSHFPLRATHTAYVAGLVAVVGTFTPRAFPPTGSYICLPTTHLHGLRLYIYPAHALVHVLHFTHTLHTFPHADVTRSLYTRSLRTHTTRYIVTLWLHFSLVGLPLHTPALYSCGHTYTLPHTLVAHLPVG